MTVACVTGVTEIDKYQNISTIQISLCIRVTAEIFSHWPHNTLYCFHFCSDHFEN